MSNSINSMNNSPLRKTQVVNTAKKVPFQRNILHKDTISFSNNTHKNISFKGRTYPSGYYSDDEIKDARKYFHLSDEEWSKKMYRIGKELTKGRGFLGEELTEDSLNSFGAGARLIGGIFTLGISELVNDIGVHQERNKGGFTYLRKMNNLKADLKNERINEQAEIAIIRTQDARRTKEYIEQTFNIKEQQLKPKLLDKIQRAKEGRPTSIPNCVMLECPSPETASNLIDWAGKNANANFVKIKHTDDIVEHLEAAEEAYQKNGNRTLLHVDGLEHLINPEKSSSSTISDFKDIMSSASEDFHSTILFSTQDPSRLDQIALQPHRVQKIKVDIKTPAEMMVADARTRLYNDKNRYYTHPIATINDLITACNPKNISKLNLDHSPEQLTLAEEALRKTLKPHTDSYFINLLKEAVKRLR